MANVYTDTTAKALWKFENGALTADSIGSNTLTASASSPTADTSDYREGSACANFARANGQYFSITGASLASGFPFKSRDTKKQATICCWVRPATSGSQWRRIWAKFDYAGNKRCFDLCLYNNEIRIEAGSGTGSGYQSWNTGITLVNGEWYHLGVIIDGSLSGLWFNLIVYRVSNGATSTYAGVLPAELWVGNVPFTIGIDGTYDANACFDGKIDELVVFPDILPTSAVDSIRSGSYNPAASVQANAAGAMVGHALMPTAQVLLGSGGAMVGFTEGVMSATGVMVGYLTSPDPTEVKINTVGAMVGYTATPPVTIKRQFPVPPEFRLTQTQTGKRVFPVVI